MALQNGVLVHGPTSWAAAVRDDNGELHVASGKKPRFGDSVDTPVLRGPLRLAEAFALLPMVRRALPQARFPFARPAVVGSIIASSLVARGLRQIDALAGRKGSRCRRRLAPAGSARTSGIRPRRVSRRRACLHRDLRERCPRAEGAPALRLAADRTDARLFARGECRSCSGSGSDARLRAPPRDRGCDRRLR